MSSIGSWVGLFATLLAAVVLYLRWRSDVIFVKPSVITELQNANSDLSRDLDIERKRRREFEDQLRHFTKACDIKVAELERRIQELECINGKQKEIKHG